MTHMAAEWGETSRSSEAAIAVANRFNLLSRQRQQFAADLLACPRPSDRQGEKWRFMGSVGRANGMASGQILQFSPPFRTAS